MEWKIVIDTGTWMKFDILLHLQIISSEFIDILYKLGKISITPEIESELTHYQIYSWQKSKTYVLPVKNIEAYQRALNDGFDPADASLFGIEDPSHMIIITEDRPLQKYGMVWHLNILFLIDFFIKLLDSELITKNDLYVLNHHLYQLRNITQKKYLFTKKYAQQK